MSVLLARQTICFAGFSGQRELTNAARSNRPMRLSEKFLSYQTNGLRIYQSLLETMIWILVNVRGRNSEVWELEYSTFITFKAFGRIELSTGHSIHHQNATLKLNAIADRMFILKFKTFIFRVFKATFHGIITSMALFIYNSHL